MEDEAPSQTKETDVTDLERFKETLKELEARSLEEKKQPDDWILLTEGCSAILTKKPQQKRDDFISLPIPCSIGVGGAFCDLNTNINLVTLSLVNRLMTDSWQLVLLRIGFNPSFIMNPKGMRYPSSMEVENLASMVLNTSVLCQNFRTSFHNLRFPYIRIGTTPHVRSITPRCWSKP
ncbi:hypothetical protein L195_g052494 [Trifolium pratense]|uniref:Uncharacterized protein n=1 Tax=Trifolium pratense TaxID=57577 RepID=A0A2K3K5E6_TRIPR|nr:hypothetical protein L195_g052494 [Trifolium pratense]